MTQFATKPLLFQGKQCVDFHEQKLKNTLEKFNPDLSTWENMQLHGYNRIWDCVSHVFEWKKS